MKTLVIISDFSNGNYTTKTIQILTHPYKDSLSTNYIGAITFFKRNDALVDGTEWMGMKFKIETSDAKEVVAMGKLATYISNNSNWSAQPSEILQVIGAVVHFYFKGEYLPLTDKGSRLWMVLNGSQVYTTLVAPNYTIASRKMDKLGLSDPSLGDSFLIN